MRLNAEATKSLSAYLSRELAPLTDADADVLGDYIIALLKHDKPLPDLQRELAHEINDFLREGMQNEKEHFLFNLFGELARYQGTSQPAAHVSVAPPAPASSSQSYRPRHEELASVPERRDEQQPVRERSREINREPIREIKREPYRRRSISPPPRQRSPPPTDRYERRRRSPPRQHRDDRNDRESTRRVTYRRDRSRSPGNSRIKETENGLLSKAPENVSWGREPENSQPSRSIFDRLDQGADNFDSRDKPEQRVCYEFKNRGSCSRGDACRFLHVAAQSNESRNLGDRFNNNNNRDERFQPTEAKLTVNNIPDEGCSVAQVQAYFSKFGTIENVIVYWHDRKAVVEFLLIASAQSVLESPEAPWNNRFVTINWWQPHHDRRLVPTASLKPISLTTTKSSDDAMSEEVNEEAKAQRAANAEAEKKIIAAQLDELKQRQETERELLISQLGNVNEQDKSEILQSLSSVSKDLAEAQKKQTTSQKLKLKLEAAKKRLQEGDPSQQTAKQLMEKIKQASTGGGDTADLLLQLEAIKEEHAALGLADQEYTPSFRGRGRGARGIRGRGRGRGARGGFAKSMTLDLRPRSLQVSNIPPSLDFRTHFCSFGPVAGIQVQGSTGLVRYMSRFAAEKAIKFGAVVGTDTMTLEWSNDIPAEAQSQASLNPEDGPMAISDDDEQMEDAM